MKNSRKMRYLQKKVLQSARKNLEKQKEVNETPEEEFEMAGVRYKEDIQDLPQKEWVNGSRGNFHKNGRKSKPNFH